jgi:hypothetical protein
MIDTLCAQMRIEINIRETPRGHELWFDLVTAPREGTKERKQD